MVTLIKRCKRHAILLGDNEAALQSAFTAAFPEAKRETGAQEWIIPWEKGFYAQSNAVLEAFFTAQGESMSHIDEC